MSTEHTPAVRTHGQTFFLNSCQLFVLVNPACITCVFVAKTIGIYLPADCRLLEFASEQGDLIESYFLIFFVVLEIVNSRKNIFCSSVVVKWF